MWLVVERVALPNLAARHQTVLGAHVSSVASEANGAATRDIDEARDFPEEASERHTDNAKGRTSIRHTKDQASSAASAVV